MLGENASSNCPPPPPPSPPPPPPPQLTPHSLLQWKKKSFHYDFLHNQLCQNLICSEFRMKPMRLSGWGGDGLFEKVSSFHGYTERFVFAENYQLYVPESAQVGKPVGKIKANDEDIGVNADIKYSIINSEGANTFSISTDRDTREGVISLRKVPSDWTFTPNETDTSPIERHLHTYNQCKWCNNTQLEIWRDVDFWHKWSKKKKKN